MQIRFHVLEHQVEVFVVLGANHLFESDYVGVLDFVEQGYLSEGALCVGGVLESIKYLFKGEG